MSRTFAEGDLAALQTSKLWPHPSKISIKTYYNVYYYPFDGFTCCEERPTKAGSSFHWSPLPRKCFAPGPRKKHRRKASLRNVLSFFLRVEKSGSLNLIYDIFFYHAVRNVMETVSSGVIDLFSLTSWPGCLTKFATNSVCAALIRSRGTVATEFPTVRLELYASVTSLQPSYHHQEWSFNAVRTRYEGGLKPL